MYPARDNRISSPSLKEGRRPAWNQNQPHRPSRLRRAASASLPRSQRVTSLVDLLPPCDDKEENEEETEKEDDQAFDEDDMTPTRRDVLSAEYTNGGHATRIEQQPSGLGINLNTSQQLEKVDEWLESENEDVGSPSYSTRGRFPKTRRPSNQNNRRTPSSQYAPMEVEMMPPPLSLPKHQPTTPGGGKRAYPEPEAKAEDVGKRPEQLIDEMLEGLYRDQSKSLTKSAFHEFTLLAAEEEGDKEPTPTKMCQGQATRLNVPSFQADQTPPRRISTTRLPSLSENQHTIGFAPSPSRTDPFRPSPLRISRKPVESPKIVFSEPKEFEPTSYKSYPILPIKVGPSPVEPAPYAYAHRIYSKPETVNPLIVRYQHQRGNSVPRPLLYFFDDERESILQSVLAKNIVCKVHTDCTECIEKEFAYFEIKAMPTTVPPEERAKILAGNRSLRTIKTELENLLENGLISDDVYNAITQQLPNEGTFNNTQQPSAPTSSFQALSVNEPPPPAYNTPSLPTRQTTAPPTRPEISRAVALYPYSEPDDCTFVVGDEIAVYEHMNKDWWMGRNVRTGKEGVFPVNYVTPKATGPSPSGYPNEKAQPYGGYPSQQQQQYQQHQGPPPPGPSNPYNSDVPPQAVANQPSKGGEMGKKFGKKLGNAAIFGAGASIGGKIVNGIF